MLPWKIKLVVIYAETCSYFHRIFKTEIWFWRKNRESVARLVVPECSFDINAGINLFESLTNNEQIAFSIIRPSGADEGDVQIAFTPKLKIIIKSEQKIINN